MQQPVYKRAIGKQQCRYGADCYRGNPKHWEAFDHPPDHPFLSAQQRNAVGSKRSLDAVGSKRSLEADGATDEDEPVPGAAPQ
eukprot:6136825-Prymnesium_polylepis.1